MNPKSPDSGNASPGGAGIRASQATFHDDGNNLIVEIHLTNDSSGTLYAYSTPRNIQYDSTSRTLKVLLSDRQTAERHRSNFVHPDFVVVQPGRETLLTLRLPRTLASLTTAKQPGPPLIERTPVHEATSVQVGLDWSDKPFSPDPRNVKSAREQLMAWPKSTLIVECSPREARPSNR